MARLRRIVARAADRRAVLAPGEVILIACSGGPDSTALLDTCMRLGPPRGWILHVAHVDHGLREGGAAEADQVAAVVEPQGLELHRLRVTVERGGSLQDNARRARHGALRQLATRIGATAIALGHTADDQAETVLMRALSGATPRALRAMGERDGVLARPLLTAWRADTAAYCLARALATVDDPSNTDSRFLRTQVRHELIPALEAVFPAARRRLIALAEGQRRLLEDRASPSERSPIKSADSGC